LRKVFFKKKREERLVPHFEYFCNEKKYCFFLLSG
jgi:hypothetical protein